MNNVVLFGCGFRFHGTTFRSTEEKRDGILVTTRWFVLLYAPLIPVSSWLVRNRGAGVNNFRPTLRNYALIQHLPLFWPQILRTWLWTALAAALIVSARIWLIR